LDYGRGPEKVWVYEALRVGDGQALTLTPRSRNTAGYLRLLEAVARANPRGRPLPLITDNLSSHKSPPIRECLEKHPRIEQVFIPVGACWLNLQEAWWRLFRREALAGHQTFADGEEIERAAQVATLQLNRRAKPWVWGERTSPEGIGGAHLFTAFEEQSITGSLWISEKVLGVDPKGLVSWLNYGVCIGSSKLVPNDPSSHVLLQQTTAKQRAQVQGVYYKGFVSRGCYGLEPIKAIARCRKRHAKATKCRPATVADSRS
jgi:DDE superfamily endonuclease